MAKKGRLFIQGFLDGKRIALSDSPDTVDRISIKPFDGTNLDEIQIQATIKTRQEMGALRDVLAVIEQCFNGFPEKQDWVKHNGMETNAPLGYSPE